MDLPYDVYLGLLIPESSQKRAQLHQAIRPNRFAPKQIWDTHHLHYLIGYWRELNEYTEQNFAPGTPIKAFVAIIDFSILHYGSYGPGTFRNDIERVFEFRKLYPFVPIVLCVDKETYEDFKSDLPPEWRHRLEHYYTVQYDRQDFDECCARIVANAVSWSQRSVHRKLDEKRRQCMVFVSYARKDVRRA
ncbi:MAG: hypothetical protein FJ267_14245, partial [Planctomycetes bacterium]|nr:hypothetical protein [Planctomycetota bacterium]